MRPPRAPLTPLLRFLIAAVSLASLQGMAPDPRPAVHSLSAAFRRPLRFEAPHLTATLDVLTGGLTRKALDLIADPARLVPVLPRPARSFRVTAVTSRQTGSSSLPSARLPAGELLWPVQGRITSGYGMRRHPITRRMGFHPAIDIQARRGTPVLAPADGVVVRVGRAGGMGRMVKLRANSGLILYFGHLSAYRARAGQKVRRGQVLGLVGSTGRSTGPHLHFAVMRAGRSVNPLTLLPRRG